MCRLVIIQSGLTLQRARSGYTKKKWFVNCLRMCIIIIIIIIIIIVSLYSNLFEFPLCSDINKSLCLFHRVMH